MKIERKEFYKVEEIIDSVETQVKRALEKGEHIDYLTFVPDGEPTLDINLGKEIDYLRKLNIKIAIISNASLIWQEEVRDELYKADWVSLKVDAVSEKTWHSVDRPHGLLNLDKILQGILEFSRNFEGYMVTETMLVNGVNDSPDELEKIADFISTLKSKKSYISIPIRPPAEKWVKASSEERVNTACQIFREHSIDVEHLIGYEGNEFAFTGNVKEDILSITSVHPMRKDAVEELLGKAGQEWNTVEKLINEGKLLEVDYKNKKYYIRKLGIDHGEI